MNNNRGLIIVVLVAMMMVLCSPAVALMTSHQDNMTLTGEMSSYEENATQAKIVEDGSCGYIRDCAGMAIKGNGHAIAHVGGTVSDEVKYDIISQLIVTDGAEIEKIGLEKMEGPEAIQGSWANVSVLNDGQWSRLGMGFKVTSIPDGTSDNNGFDVCIVGPATAHMLGKGFLPSLVIAAYRENAEDYDAATMQFRSMVDGMFMIPIGTLNETVLHNQMIADMAEMKEFRQIVFVERETVKEDWYRVSQHGHLDAFLSDVNMMPEDDSDIIFDNGFDTCGAGPETVRTYGEGLRPLMNEGEIPNFVFLDLAVMDPEDLTGGKYMSTRLPLEIVNDDATFSEFATGSMGISQFMELHITGDYAKEPVE